MDYVGGFGGALFIVAGLVALGIVLFLVIGYPLIRKLGSGAGGLFYPDDESFRDVPGYSIAEARVKQGLYTEAIAEYRKVIDQFPADTYAHVRIAELCLERMNDPATAERELRAAFEKAATDDGVALIGGRLADVYQYTLKNPERARETLVLITQRVRAPKHQRLIQQRLDALGG